jgi:hydroxymethylpyrimidine/phosphomethylpyrimidine kinase
VTKTVHALGGYACNVVTAISVQTPDKMMSVKPMDAELVKDQLQAVKDTYPKIDGVVIGLLPSKDIIKAVCSFLDDIHDEDVFVALDPVMINQAGFEFLGEDEIQEIKRLLMVHADIITPNIFEAQKLTGVDIEDHEKAEQAAEMLMTYGCGSVYLKHETIKDEQVHDLFLDEDNFYVVESPVLTSKNTHGAGTTLAAAIVTSFSMGMELAPAVSGARGYLAEAIEHAEQIVDEGVIGPLDHFV